MSDPAKRHATRGAPHPQTPVLEWVLGGIGLTLLLAAVTFLLVAGLQGPEQPRRVTVTSTAVVELADGYLVQFTARNEGAAALAALRIGARVLQDQAVLESTETVIDTLPGGSRRSGGFYLRHDPRQHELQLHALSYQTP